MTLLVFEKYKILKIAAIGLMCLYVYKTTRVSWAVTLNLQQLEARWDCVVASRVTGLI